MPSQSLTDVVLAVFEDDPSAQPLSTNEIISRVQDRYSDGGRVPGNNEITGRLSTLAREGIVSRPERGQYTLARAPRQETEAIARLTDLLIDLFRPTNLRRTVVWDATPYLDLAEDGSPGTRLVIEQAQAGAIADELTARWPNNQGVATWVTKRSGPIGDWLWFPQGEPIATRPPTALVLVERERLGATGLTADGLRTPFPERVLCEFIGDTGPADATPIVRTLLRDERTTLEKLSQAAETLGVTTELAALVVGAEDSVPSFLREEYIADLAPVVRQLIERGFE